MKEKNKIIEYEKRIKEPEVPNVLPHAKFGLNLMLLVMYLRFGLRLPVDKIRSYFMDMYRWHLESIMDGLKKQSKFPE